MSNGRLPQNPRLWARWCGQAASGRVPEYFANNRWDRVLFAERPQTIYLTGSCVGGLALVFGTITVRTPSW
jgi:hypothetical protein